MPVCSVRCCTNCWPRLVTRSGHHEWLPLSSCAWLYRRLQVSHHPPVGAAHAETDLWTFDQVGTCAQHVTHCDCRQSMHAAGRASGVEPACIAWLPTGSIAGMHSSSPLHPHVPSHPAPRCLPPRPSSWATAWRCTPLVSSRGGDELGSVQPLPPGKAPPEQCGAWAASARQRHSRPVPVSHYQ